MAVPKNQEKVLEFSADAEIYEDNYMKFPVLYTRNTAGKIRHWRAILAIENGEDWAPMKREYVNRAALPDGYWATWWSEYGVEDGVTTESAPKNLYKGKNIGRSNYTTPFTQAVLDIKSEYDRNIRKGAVYNSEDLDKNAESIEKLIMDNSRGAAPWRIFAMLMHDVCKSNNWRHIKWPAYIQPKLDGTLALIVYHPELPQAQFVDANGETHLITADSYTRGRTNSERCGHIIWENLEIFKKFPGLHIVGELYKEGLGLQKISGASRRQQNTRIKDEMPLLELYVFDCFYIGENPGFAERRKTLDSFFATGETEYLRRMPTEIMQNRSEADNFYHSYIKKGLEGAVIRNIDAPYEWGLHKAIRSYKTLKWKPRPDDEYPVVDFTSGKKGKAADMVVWVCAENDEGVKGRAGKLLELWERKTFNVDPNWSQEDRRRILELLRGKANLFKEKIYGHPLTITYSILSENGLPQQPKAIRFREPEINDILFS